VFVNRVVFCNRKCILFALFSRINKRSYMFTTINSRKLLQHWIPYYSAENVKLKRKKKNKVERDECFLEIGSHQILCKIIQHLAAKFADFFCKESIDFPHNRRDSGRWLLEGIVSATINLSTTTNTSYFLLQNITRFCINTINQFISYVV